MLSTLLGVRVKSVERGPLEAEHFSGNTLERVRVMRNGQEVNLVLKHFSIERDWIMRLTHDTSVREVALFRGGVYDRMPEQVYVPVIAAARDGDSWASLMMDVSPWLVLSVNQSIPAFDLKCYLDHLAAVHARFMNDETLLNPEFGLSTLEDFVMILSPANARREVEEGRAHPILEMAIRGWEVFEEVARPEAVQIIRNTQKDLRPLLAAVTCAPRTLVHGDFKLANLGSLPPPQSGAQVGTEPRTIILDWQDATFSSPLLDIGYFLAINSAFLPVSKEETIQMYRDSLAGHNWVWPPRTWERDLAVGLLAGGAMRVGWQKALGTQSDDSAVRERACNEMERWSEGIVRAGRWLE